MNINKLFPPIYALASVEKKCFYFNLLHSFFLFSLCLRTMFFCFFFVLAWRQTLSNFVGVERGLVWMEEWVMDHRVLPSLSWWNQESGWAQNVGQGEFSQRLKAYKQYNYRRQRFSKFISGKPVEYVVMVNNI